MATQTIARSKTGRWRYTIIAVSITVIAALIVTVAIAVALAGQVVPGRPGLGPNTNTYTREREGGPLGLNDDGTGV